MSTLVLWLFWWFSHLIADSLQINTKLLPKSLHIMNMKHIIEPLRDKTNKVSVRPGKTQISLCIHPVWSESSLCTQWVAKGPSFLHADSEDSDQTGQMARLIWVFAGRTTTLLVFCHEVSQLTLCLWVCCSAFQICPSIFFKRNYCHKNSCVFVFPMSFFFFFFTVFSWSMHILTDR